MSEHIVTQDPPGHTRTRGLLGRLLTPKRLKENEDFMWRLADQQLDEFASAGLRVPRRLCEAVLDARSSPTCSESRRRTTRCFGEALAATDEIAGALDDDSPAHNPLLWLDDKFTDYIIDRRREPREDVLTELRSGEISRRVDA